MELGGARVYVSPDARLRYLKRNIRDADPVLFNQALALALVEPGSRVWDLGANVGLFAFSAAGLSGLHGRVLAVEADPWLFSLLQRSRAATVARLHSVAPVDLLCAAVADRAPIARFSIAARGRAANAVDGFGSSQTGGSRESIMVGQVTLDSILEHSFVPDIVKIDVEGAELLVLRSGSALLQARPLILVEVMAVNAGPVADLFRAASYELFDASKPLESIRRVDAAVWDTLAVSIEKVFSLKMRVE